MTRSVDSLSNDERSERFVRVSVLAIPINTAIRYVPSLSPKSQATV